MRARSLCSIIAWIALIISTVSYVFWALLSHSPSRYWALAVPALIVTAVCLYGVTYGCLALALTPKRDAPSVLSDAHAKPLQRRALSPLSASGAPRRRRIPEFADASPALVSAALFIARRAETEEPLCVRAAKVDF